MKCAFCDQPSTLLCDFVLGWTDFEWHGGRDDKPRRVVTNRSEMLTCDAPLCGGCRTQIGQIFLPGEMDTRDRCPLHPPAGEPRHRPPVELTKPEAEAIRLRTWKMKYGAVAGGRQ